jgi:hypothetical protein
MFFSKLTKNGYVSSVFSGESLKFSAAVAVSRLHFGSSSKMLGGGAVSTPRFLLFFNDRP